MANALDADRWARDMIARQVGQALALIQQKGSNVQPSEIRLSDRWWITVPDWKNRVTQALKDEVDNALALIEGSLREVPPNVRAAEEILSVLRASLVLRY
jgi:hypothetical protein